MKNEFGITIVAVEKIGQRDALRLTGEHPKHVSKPSLYPKKIMTVRSSRTYSLLGITIWIYDCTKLSFSSSKD